jgi:hypothetical protein
MLNTPCEAERTKNVRANIIATNLKTVFRQRISSKRKNRTNHETQGFQESEINIIAIELQ